VEEGHEEGHVPGVDEQPEELPELLLVVPEESREEADTARSKRVDGDAVRRERRRRRRRLLRRSTGPLVTAVLAPDHFENSGKCRNLIRRFPGNANKPQSTQLLSQFG